MADFNEDVTVENAISAKPSGDKKYDDMLKDVFNNTDKYALLALEILKKNLEDAAKTKDREKELADVQQAIDKLKN